MTNKEWHEKFGSWKNTWPGFRAEKTVWEGEPAFLINSRLYNDLQHERLLKDFEPTQDRALLARGYLGTYKGKHILHRQVADALVAAKFADKQSEQYKELKRFRTLTHKG